MKFTAWTCKTEKQLKQCPHFCSPKKRKFCDLNQHCGDTWDAALSQRWFRRCRPVTVTVEFEEKERKK
jgi:hypothetical protein